MGISEFSESTLFRYAVEECQNVMEKEPTAFDVIVYLYKSRQTIIDSTNAVMKAKECIEDAYNQYCDALNECNSQRKIFVRELGLSVRAYNVLARAYDANIPFPRPIFSEIECKDVIKKLTKNDISQYRNCGRKTYDEIITAFENKGFKFREV
jgi:DNA-directed RNA polymerase alpha subunit